MKGLRDSPSSTAPSSNSNAPRQSSRRPDARRPLDEDTERPAASDDRENVMCAVFMRRRDGMTADSRVIGVGGRVEGGASRSGRVF